MGKKYDSMCHIRDIGLPTVKFKGFSHREATHNKQAVKEHVEDLLTWEGSYGIFGVRTEPVGEDKGIGHYPHCYPCHTYQQAMKFIREHGDSLYYIINEGFPGDCCEFNAVVRLSDHFGHLKLWGEINYDTKLCLRDAMKDSKNILNVRDVHNNDMANLRHHMKKAGLVNGETVEVAKFDNGRMVFWEIQPAEKIEFTIQNVNLI